MRARLTSALRWLLAVLAHYTGGLALQRFIRLRLFGAGRVWILRYHRVFADDEQRFYGLGFSSRLFREHLQFLQRGFTMVPLEDAVRTLQNGSPSKDMVALTFDDGYEDNLRNAWPVLRSLNLPATIFVVTGAVEAGRPFFWDRLAAAVERSPRPAVTIPQVSAGPLLLGNKRQRRSSFDRLRAHAKRLDHEERERFLTEVTSALGCDPDECSQDDRPLSWEQIREMAAAGVGFGAHTVTHPLLTALRPDRLRAEIRGSKEMMEGRLSNDVPYFAYPTGDYDERIRQEVIGAGFRAAVSSRLGYNRPGADLYALHRKPIDTPMLLNPWGRFSPALLAFELSGMADRLFARAARLR